MLIMTCYLCTHIHKCKQITSYFIKRVTMAIVVMSSILLSQSSDPNTGYSCYEVQYSPYMAGSTDGD